MVEIKAEFPWGSETVETVRFLGAKVFENVEGTERELFEVYCRFIYSRLLSKHPPCVNKLWHTAFRLFKTELFVPV